MKILNIILLLVFNIYLLSLQFYIVAILILYHHNNYIRKVQKDSHHHLKTKD